MRKKKTRQFLKNFLFKFSASFTEKHDFEKFLTIYDYFTQIIVSLLHLFLVLACSSNFTENFVIIFTSEKHNLHDHNLPSVNP